jgi:hypothetical protein
MCECEMDEGNAALEIDSFSYMVQGHLAWQIGKEKYRCC